MCLASNQQRMYYALQNGQVPIYETDEDGNIIYYKDNEGNSYPLETGEYEVGYTESVEFLSNLAMAGGEAEAQEYGLSIGDYNATCVCSKNAYPIVEGSLIWHKSKVGYKDIEETIIDPLTADYTVKKVSESLNFVKYVLKAIVK